MGSDSKTKEPRSGVAKAGRAREAAQAKPARGAKFPKSAIPESSAGSPARPRRRRVATEASPAAAIEPGGDGAIAEATGLDPADVAATPDAPAIDPAAVDALPPGEPDESIQESADAPAGVPLEAPSAGIGDSDTLLLTPDPGVMEFAITPQSLGAGLAAVVAALPARTTLPVLQQVLIRTEGDGHILLTATDLDTTVTQRVPATVSEPGSALVSGQKLAQITRELPEGCIVDVRLRADAVHVSCSATRSRYRLPTVPLDEFPTTPRIVWTDELVVTGDVLGLLIARSAFSASTEETRPILQGVLWERTDGEMAMVATNGHRLSSTRISVPGLTAQPEVIFPRRALSLLTRVAAESKQVVFARTANHVGFRGENWELVTRTIEGPYPNYRQILPQDNDKVLTVDRGAFAAAIRRMAIVASAETHRIRLALGDPTTMRISVETPDLGAANEDVPVEYQGDPLEIGFNAVYLLEMLRHLPAGDLRLTLKAPERPATMEPVADEAATTLMLVMPLRLLS